MSTTLKQLRVKKHLSLTALSCKVYSQSYVISWLPSFIHNYINMFIHIFFSTYRRSFSWRYRQGRHRERHLSKFRMWVTSDIRPGIDPWAHLQFVCDPPVVARFVSVDDDNTMTSKEYARYLTLCGVMVEEYRTEECLQAASKQLQQKQCNSWNSKFGCE